MGTKDPADLAAQQLPEQVTAGELVRGVRLHQRTLLAWEDGWCEGGRAAKFLEEVAKWRESKGWVVVISDAVGVERCRRSFTQVSESQVRSLPTE